MYNVRPKMAYQRYCVSDPKMPGWDLTSWYKSMLDPQNGYALGVEALINDGLKLVVKYS